MIPIYNWNGSTSITMKRPVADLYLEQFWWTWRPALWTTSGLDLLAGVCFLFNSLQKFVVCGADYLVLTRSYLDKAGLGIIGPRECTLKGLN